MMTGDIAVVAGVEKLRLKYPGEERLLFRDVSLHIQQGERVLLLGPSGCGKSTLLQVMTGLIPHAVDMPMHAEQVTIPDRWAFVFQDPDTQFCMPYVDEELAFVLENLCVPRAEMQARMNRLLERVGLRLPDLHVPIASLSQGMKQRLALASALALKPDVLFLDEPTALLDPAGTRQVWETIRTMKADCTIVIVEHKIEHIVDLIDRVVLFDAAGGIVADGPAARLFADYAEQLREDGIWYPGVWNDYIASRNRIQPEREQGQVALEIQRTEARETDVPTVGQEADMWDVHTPASLGGESSEPLIRLHAFDCCRGKQVRLHVADASVGPGEWIAVVGDNGAGKTTLMLALMQLVRTKGSYELYGKPIAAYTDLSRELAFVFQNPEFQFVTQSVWDEVAFSLRQDKVQEEEIQARSAQLLRQFALDGYEKRHPYQLSLGQKRRLSVASAVVKEQRIILLDEPTFGQDARNTFSLLERLDMWRKRGSTIVMVTHDPDIVQHFATRVWRIADGQLHEETAAGAAQQMALSGRMKGTREAVACH